MSEGRFRERLLERAAAARIQLEDAQIAQLGEYWHLLALWNRTINLTALPLAGFPDAALDRLIVEPLAARELMPAAPARWYDLGSGGGSPAIPLRIVLPHLELTLVEPRERKCAFLREAVRKLDIPGTSVLMSRLEALGGEHRTRAACVTVRGLKLDAKRGGHIHRLLSPGGRLILFAGAAPIEIEDFSLVQEVPLPGTRGSAQLFTPQ